ncbi:MAG: NAD(P)/FAD-dependent oxidoreductase, partial [Bacteroidota bacterium]
VNERDLKIGLQGFLKDEMEQKEILINEKSFYEENGIDIELETSAKSVNFGKKSIQLDNDEEIIYDKLLIATGAKLRRLKIKGSELEGVFYLRSIDQSKSIKEYAKSHNKAVVVGGQYIGSELAAGLKTLGTEVDFVFPEDRMLSKFATADIAGFFQNYYRDKGINILPNDEIIQIMGDSKVKQVELRSGKKLHTEMVVAGIGVEPFVDLFKNTGLNLNDGIVVNEYCETNIPDVYAAGDVARFPDFIFDKMRRIEHWENAFEQGKHAAAVMSGRRERYEFLPYFFSDVFDLSYEFFGDTEDADSYFYRGNIDSGNFSTWWFRSDILQAAFIMGERPDEEREKAREWIKNKTILNAEEIEYEDNNLDDILKAEQKG